MREALKYFNISDASFIRFCRKNNIKKDTNQIYKNYKKTTFQKYGVENAFQLDSVKEKSKQTTLQKYGKEHFVQTEEYKNKNIETRIERYGEDDPFQREKFKETCVEKYGVENPDYIGFTEDMLKLVKDKDYLVKYIKEHNIKNASELASFSGIKVNLANRISNLHEVRNLFDYTGSQYERILQEIVKQVGLEYIPNYKIPNSRKEIDVYIPSKKLGIEFNGDYWHSELTRPMEYHQGKSKSAEEQGIFIYHIYEYQWKKYSVLITKEILELLGVKREYDKEYQIKEVPYNEAKRFIEENSLYEVYNIDFSYGLYVDNKLIHIQSFLNGGDGYYFLLFDINMVNEDYKDASNLLLSHFKANNKCNKLIIQTNVGYKNQNYPYQMGYRCSGYFEPEYKWLKSTIVEDAVDGEDIDKRHSEGWLKLYDCGIKIFTL